MENRRRTVAITIAIALGAAMSLTACPDKEGPVEKAGKAVDEAAGDAKRAVQDATD